MRDNPVTPTHPDMRMGEVSFTILRTVIVSAVCIYIYIYVQLLSKRLSSPNIYKYINIGHVIRRKVRIPVQMLYNKALNV